MNKNIVETLIGAFVLFVAGMFVFTTYKSGNIGVQENGYNVIAKFNKVGDLSIGSDVRVSGIKIGYVSNQSLDTKTYRAVVELSLSNEFNLPKDSSAAIVSNGLLGSKYIEIEPGGEEAFLKNNSEIIYTQDAVSLESLITKFAFGGVTEE